MGYTNLAWGNSQGTRRWTLEANVSFPRFLWHQVVRYVEVARQAYIWSDATPSQYPHVPWHGHYGANLGFARRRCLGSHHGVLCTFGMWFVVTQYDATTRRNPIWPKLKKQLVELEGRQEDMESMARMAISWKYRPDQEEQEAMKRGRQQEQH